MSALCGHCGKVIAERFPLHDCQPNEDALAEQRRRERIHKSKAATACGQIFQAQKMLKDLGEEQGLPYASLLHRLEAIRQEIGDLAGLPKDDEDIDDYLERE